MQTIVQILSKELEKKEEYVQNVVTLLDEGNTVPFIARYRKEMHGTMDDQTIRTLADRLQYLRNLEARRQEVKTSIENQGKLPRRSTVRRRLPRWKIYTARINKSAARARPSQKKRA